MVEPIYRLKIDLSSDVVTIKSQMQELQQEIENKAKEFARLENAVKHFDSLPDMILEYDYIHLDNEFQKLYPQNNKVDNDERIQTSETSNRIEVTSSSSQVVNDPKKLHSCHICGKAFISEYKLKRHSVCHSDERPFECEYCGKRFKNEAACRYHGLIHTKKWPHKCNKCDKGYLTPKQLAVHKKKKHTGKRDVGNEERIQTSETSNGIEVTSSSSQVANDPKKRHLCHICGKAFISKSKLKQHSVCHSDERPFKCEYCGKPFKNEAACRYHGLIHTKKWPHKCNKCDKGYLSPKQLAVHMNKHTGERPFKCDRCLKTFRTFCGKKVHRC